MVSFSLRPTAMRLPKAGFLVRAAFAAAAVLAGSPLASPAKARVFFGVGVPFFYPGPVIVAPPVYYPPAYYPQPGYAPSSTFSYTPPAARPQSLAPAGGPQECVAGRYTCPLLEDVPPGADCSCPGHDGKQIRGVAN